MRLPLYKLLVLPWLALAWLSCDQDLNSAADQPTVNYVFVVTDSATALPLDSVRIRVTTITGDTATYFTGKGEGRAQLPTLASSRTVFEFSRPGYGSRDSTDTLTSPVDSVFHRAVPRLIRIRMIKGGTALDSSRPVLLEKPADSVNAGDSLFFRFSQKVETLDAFQVSLINQSQLLTDMAWDPERKRLKVWLKDSKWITGKKYGYALRLRNGAGQYFTGLGDTLKDLQGIFSVRSDTARDSAVALPHHIAFAYFNSGGYAGFAEADSNSSPKADSSSQYARLKWGWGADSGHKVDSLQIYYKDGSPVASSWTLWGTVPGFADSATLNFSERYATFLDPNGKAPLPFRISGKIDFRIVPKQGSKTYPDTTLDALEQGMGPTVYVNIAKFNSTDSLTITTGQKDSLQVTFYRSATDHSSPFNWGGKPWPTPVCYFNGEKNPAYLAWSWTESPAEKAGRFGRVDYTIPTILTLPSIRVDMNGVLYHGKPVWQRNAKSQFLLR